MPAPFTPEQLAKLAASGVDPEHALSKGVAPIAHADELPPELRQLRWARVPGLLFPWQRLNGDITYQFRPDSPLTNESGDRVKYVFATGVRSGVNVLRPDASHDSTLVVVEGTLQQLAVDRYAPPEMAVLGISGCWGWSEDQMPVADLSLAAGRPVVVLFDADSGGNLDVYRAGKRLEQALSNEGATSVKFARLGAGGTTGIDDLIGQRPEASRHSFVAGVIKSARAKPADKEPKAKRSDRPSDKKEIEATDYEVACEFAARYVGDVRHDASEDRWLVYTGGRWDSETGDVIVRTKFQAMISRDITCFSLNKDGEQVPEKTWLYSANTMDRVLKHARSIPTMTARREDWDTNPLLWNAANTTLDLESRTARGHRAPDLLTLQSRVAFDPAATSPQFERFLAEVLPDDEVRGFVQRLFGMAMLGEVRDHVFPVLIGSGRNGKGVLMQIVEEVFGDYATGVDDTLLVETKFETHPTKKATLHRRRLAISQETQKHARWNVAAVKDLTGGARVTARKMRQDDFTFDASHTLVMVTNHRPAVGEGEKAFWSRYREVPFTQDFTDRADTGLAKKIITAELSGVLNWLLDGLGEYLRGGLAEPAIVTAASEEAKVESDPIFRFSCERLIRTGSLADTLLNSDVYKNYREWCEAQEPAVRPVSVRMFPKEFAAATGVEQVTPRPGAGVTWERVRWGAEGVDRDANTGVRDANETQTADLDRRIVTGQGLGSDAKDAKDAKVVLPSHVDISPTESPTPSHVVPYAADKWSFASFASQTPSLGIINGSVSAGEDVGSALETQIATQDEVCVSAIVLDLETADAKDVTLRYREDGQGFFRIGGLTEDGVYRSTTDVVELATTVGRSRFVVGHNLMGFDLPVLARAVPGAIDLLAMTRQRRVLDTMILESLVNPPEPGVKPGRAVKFYKLDLLCEQYGLPGKVDDLKALAKRHGGFDAIPLDDVDYLDYLRGDVAATRALAKVMVEQGGLDNYAWREMRVAAIAATMSSAGFLVDQELLQRRYWTVAGRKAELSRKLIKRYAIPTIRSDGKPAESPHTTKDGRAALLAAFDSLGVPVEDIPLTEKGAPSFGGDSMHEVAESYADHPDVVELCEVIADLAGQRTVYGTALEYLAPDGRVHPEVLMLQASGRWSVTAPGLTVFGKRGGLVVERAVFVAAPGHVLLAADLSQVDARAVAAHCQDEAYMQMFEPGIDSHVEVAKLVWGDPTRRHDAKAIGHGWNYGMRPTNLARNAGVSEEVAYEFDRKMREQFPRLVTWKNEVREIAEAGERLDNGFGRLMRPNPQRAYTQAPALMGQGTARDLMMECLLRLPDEIVRMLRAQVHDEIVLEVPEADEAAVRQALHEAMTFEWAPPGADNPIQIVADCGPAGRNWSKCY